MQILNGNFIKSKPLVLTFLFILLRTIAYGQAKYKIEEEIIDSSIALKGNYKIDLIQLRYRGDSVFFEYKLYGKNNGKWELIQTCKMQKDGITSLDPIITDFNNDGYFDIAIRSNIAARMSNVVRTLFIFDNANRQLTLIQNSSDYPNLRFNKELNCLDAWLVSGGSVTVFLKLKNDSLIPFAEVDCFDDERTVSEIDQNGVEHIIRKDKITEDEVYDRYKNYNPLVKCKEE